MGLGLACAAAALLWFAAAGKSVKTAPPPAAADAPERITLSIDEASYARLVAKREAALRIGVLRSDDADFVPAEVATEGRRLKAKLRLKGDWTDHLRGDKWSFRVELDEGAVGGMRRFSLQHPSRRGYAYEWLFHELLHQQGLVSLRYRFAPVTLRRTQGGQVVAEQDLGLYTIEEGFAKELIESNRRREGVLVKVDESVFWDARNTLLGLGLPLVGHGDPYLTASTSHRVDVFTAGAVLESPALTAQFRTAKNLLQGYRDGTLTAEEVFDVDKLGTFSAVANLTGAQHGLIYHNLRFYYDPVASRLEPVGFDGNAGDAIEIVKPFGLPADLAYWEAFARAIDRISTPDRFEAMLAEVREPLEKTTALLKAAYTDAEFDPRILETNRRVLWNAVHPPRALQAFFVDGGPGFLELEVRGISTFPVEIVALSYLGKRDIARPVGRPVIAAGVTEPVRFLLPDGMKQLFTQKKKRKAGFDVRRDLPDLRLAWRVAGASHIGYEAIVPWRERDPGFAAGDLLRKRPNADEFPFLYVDETHKTITFQSGERTLDTTLILPRGYLVKAAPGLDLNLTHGAKIISFSPLAFTGTAEQPVYIHSSGDGQGVAVLMAGGRSVLDHVVFENLANPESEGWSLTASVMFYESPVTIRDTLFVKNRCEDALNVMRAEVRLEGGEFRETQADAFDGDFVTGSVVGTRFTSPGNDGIDVSGSQIEVRDVVVTRPGDKGVSAGEGTTLRAANVTVTGGEIGVAAKDRSTVTLYGAVLDGVKLGFTAYQKKPEYGPAFIYAQGVTLSNVATHDLVATGSVVEIDGRRMPASDKVKELMYGVEYGKASR